MLGSSAFGVSYKRVELGRMVMAFGTSMYEYVCTMTSLLASDRLPP